MSGSVNDLYQSGSKPYANVFVNSLDSSTSVIADTISVNTLNANLVDADDVKVNDNITTVSLNVDTVLSNVGSAINVLSPLSYFTNSYVQAFGVAVNVSTPSGKIQFTAVPNTPSGQEQSFVVNYSGLTVNNNIFTKVIHS